MPKDLYEIKPTQHTFGQPHFRVMYRGGSEACVCDTREAAEAIMDALNSRAELLQQRDKAIQQSQIWKQEACAKTATVHEIYQIVSGSKGEPGDWNGAESVRAAFADLVGKRDALLQACKKLCNIAEIVAVCSGT